MGPTFLGRQAKPSPTWHAHISAALALATPPLWGPVRPNSLQSPNLFFHGPHTSSNLTNIPLGEMLLLVLVLCWPGEPYSFFSTQIRHPVSGMPLLTTPGLYAVPPPCQALRSPLPWLTHTAAVSLTHCQVTARLFASHARPRAPSGQDHAVASSVPRS